MKKVKIPKHKHKLSIRIYERSFSQAGTYDIYRLIYIWNCTKCPFVVKKEIDY